MIEIDLPRMQSLSPQLDSPPPIETMQALTNLNTAADIEPIAINPSSSSMNPAKNCEWTNESEICGCRYENKSGCGCKYINKVCMINSHDPKWPFQKRKKKKPAQNNFVLFVYG